MNFCKVLMLKLFFLNFAFGFDICESKFVKDILNSPDNTEKMGNEKILLQGIKCENGELKFEFLINDKDWDGMSKDKKNELIAFNGDMFKYAYCDGILAQYRQNGVPMAFKYFKGNEEFVVKMREKDCIK